MTKKERLELANKKLAKIFVAWRMNKTITKKDFNDKCEKIYLYLDKYNVPHSNMYRRDSRDHSTFAANIYDRTLKEDISIKEYFISILKSKGHEVELKPINKGILGFPQAKAKKHPDYNLIIKNKYNEEQKNIKIDSKVSGGINIIIFKKNNIKAYAKDNAAIFFTNKYNSIYFSSTAVKRLNKFSGSPKLNYKKSNFLYKYGKNKYKKCIEISNRKSKDITMKELRDENIIEVWNKNNFNPIWTNVLKRLQGENSVK